MRHGGILGVLAAATLLTAACGGGASTLAGLSASPAAPSPSPSPSPTPNLVAYLQCQSGLSDLFDKLHELNSRLDVGLVFTEYTNRVGDAKVAYDKDITSNPAAPLGDCLTQVGLHLQNALNKYIAAVNLWNGCITKLSCTNDSIKPGLQKLWSQASAEIDKADSGLESLKS